MSIEDTADFLQAWTKKQTKKKQGTNKTEFLLQVFSTFKIMHLKTNTIYSTANENHNEIDVRSTFTVQSYVRIDRFSIGYQSSISPIIQSFK